MKANLSSRFSFAILIVAVFFMAPANTFSQPPATITHVAMTNDQNISPGYDITPGVYITFGVRWSESVTVTGSPQVVFTVGSTTQTAYYSSGGLTTVFFYRVPCDASIYGIIKLQSLNLNGGTIQNSAAPGVDADLSLAGIFISTTLVNGGPPQITGIDVTQPTCTALGSIGVQTSSESDIWVSVDNGLSYYVPTSDHTVHNLGPGSYDVVVKFDYGTCATTYAFNPVILNQPPPSPVVTAPTVTQPTCADPNGTIEINASGSGSLEYSLNGGEYQSSNTFSNLSAGDYKIAVRFVGTECVTNYASNPVTLSPPSNCVSCSISGPSQVCAGYLNNYSSTVTPSGGTVTHSWTVTGSASIYGSSTGASVNVKAGSAGSYTLTHNFTRNGTPGSCTVTATINPFPVVNLSGPSVVCPSTTNTFGSTVTPAGGTVTHLWLVIGNASINGSATGPTVSVTAGSTGFYTVKDIVTRNGCSNWCAKVVDIFTPDCNVSGASLVNPNSSNTYSSAGSEPGATLSWAIVPGGSASINGPVNGSTVNVVAGSSGSYTVTLTVTKNGCSKTCSKTVTINTCTITCPANVTVNNKPGYCGAYVSYPPATKTGSCGSGSLYYSKPSGSWFPVGTTTVNVSGSGASCSFTVTVLDNQSPVISGVSVSPSVLWPADHSMKTVTVNYNSSDNCSKDCELSVTSNEPVSGTGSGDLSPDWQIIDDHHVKLRAERKSNGTGRIYTITITCTDASGNKTTKTATVTVPLTAPSNNRVSGTADEALSKQGIDPELLIAGFSAEVMPNPAKGYFNLVINSSNNEAVDVKISTMNGNEVMRLRTTPGNTLQFGDKLAQGMYIIEVVQGKERKILKAVKL